MNFPSSFSISAMVEYIIKQLSEPGLNFYPRLAFSVFMIGLVVLIRYLVVRLIRKNDSELNSWRKWRQRSSYLAILVSIVLLLPLWISPLREALTFLGIFGAGVIIVFKEIIINIIAWLYLKIRRPFVIGNRITINDKIGDVFEIRLMDFSMIEVKPRDKGGQSTGRVLHIPNGWVFIHPMANASKEFSFNWNEIEIRLTLDSDWELAEKIILEIANNSLEHINKSDSRIRYSAEEHSIRFSRLTPYVFIEVRDGHIILNLRHLTEPRQTRNLTNRIWREILTAFAKEKNIHMADS